MAEKYVGRIFECDYKEKGKFYKGPCKKIVLHPHLGTPAAFCVDPKMGVFYVALNMDAMSEYIPEEKPEPVKEEPIEFVNVPRSYKGGRAVTKEGKATTGEISEDNIF